MGRKELTPEQSEYYHNLGQDHGAKGNDHFDLPLRDCFGLIEENARKNKAYIQGFKNAKKQKK